MKNTILTAVLFALAAVGSQLHAQDAKHSIVKTSVKKQKANSAVLVKSFAKKGMKANFEGPWKLELTPSAGVKVAKTKLTKTDLDQKNASFSLTAKGKGKVDYKKTVFVCSKDECFREVHKGSFMVK